MTVQKKILGKGTLVKIDGTTYGRVESATPPSREYATVEAPELNPQDNTGASLPLDPIELGDEIATDFTFTHYYEPNHADGLALDTKFAAKTVTAFQLVVPTATPQTITFSGVIKKLGPQQVTKLGFWKREVVVTRTTAIVVA
jgi:hypothetical protein